MITTEETDRTPTGRPIEIWKRRLATRPVLVLLGGTLLISLIAGLVAAHVTVFALDETLIEQSAVHYASDFPHSLFHDLDARATNRLYSLVLSIAFRLFDGYTAVRVDHVLSVILFVSAAFPIYLLARRVLPDPWPALAVALLSVAIPWLTLTTALFTENLSYPLFWWMMLATCNAVWRPSPGNDALALASIGLLVVTRVQFAAVFAGYAAALIGVGVLRTESSERAVRRTAVAVRATVRKSPLTMIALAVVVIGGVYVRTSGQWQHVVQQALGTYSNVVIRNGVAPNMAEGLLVELLALGLGVGVLPAIVSLVWYAKQMSRPRLDEPWIYLCASGALIFSLLAVTVLAQGGYLGALTEERYFFYVIPVFWLGTFAAFRDETVRPGELLACAVGLAALYAAIPFQKPLTAETAFLAPAQSIVPHVLTQRLDDLGLAGLTLQDTLAFIVGCAGVAAAVIWRRRATARIGWTVGIATVLQLLVTGYAFAVVTGHVSGIVGRTGGSASALGWVDRQAKTSNVTWLDNLSTSAPLAQSGSADQQRSTLFWNPTLTGWAAVPQIGLPAVESPLSALPGVSLAVDHTSGVVLPQAAAAPMREVVDATDSPFVQLAGTSLGRSPDGVLSLIALAAPTRATWLAEGLQPDGYVAAGAPVRVYAFTQKATAPTGVRISLVVSPLSAARPGGMARQTAVTIRLGSVSRRVPLAAGGSARQVDLTVCLPAGRTVVTGTIQASASATVSSRAGAGTITAVRQTTFPATRC
jgi:hypothetical protein